MMFFIIGNELVPVVFAVVLSSHFKVGMEDIFHVVDFRIFSFILLKRNPIQKFDSGDLSHCSLEDIVFFIGVYQGGLSVSETYQFGGE